MIAKSELPHSIGQAPAIQLPCAFFSAVFLPFGTFLALHALLAQTERRRQLLIEFLSGLGFLPLLLSFYFFTYFTLSRIPDLVGSPPNVLPKMADVARTFPKQEQREKIAAYAYQFYGVIIAYPLDDDQVVYYVPSEEDKNKRRDMEKADAQIKRKVAFIERITLQFPYLFALYACTYSAAFLAGGTWLVFKTPKSTGVPKP